MRTLSFNFSRSRVGVDLCSGQKSEEHTAEAGQKVDPGGSVHVQKVSTHDAQGDLYDGHREGEADGEQAGEQHQRQP